MTSTKSVVIIGGGPSGFAAARALSAEGGFNIIILEAQEGPGGVWIYTGNGPMYKTLNTNIPVKLMEYKGTPFSGDQLRFAPRTEVRDYVEDYCEATAKMANIKVQYKTKVLAVSKEASQWIVKTDVTENFTADFLVVATGHYSVPYVPTVFKPYVTATGLIRHARYYAVPEEFEGKKLLMIGNGPSAVDITVQCIGTVQQPVTVSIRQSTPEDKLFDPKDVVYVPEVVNVELRSSQASKDGDNGGGNGGEHPDKNTKIVVTYADGRKDEFDAVIVATGYLYEYPFLERWDSQHAEHRRVLSPNRQRLQNLYRRIFYGEDPTLAFVAMEKLIIPMPYAETQGAAIARVWSGRLSLPSADEVHREDLALEKARPGQSSHVLGYPADAEYMDSVWDWTESSSGTGGFVAERWDKNKREIRRTIADLKKPDIIRKINEAQEQRQKRDNV